MPSWRKGVLGLERQSNRDRLRAAAADAGPLPSPLIRAHGSVTITDFTAERAGPRRRGDFAGPRDVPARDCRPTCATVRLMNATR
ncbi:hypothetical protein EVAR_8346_1 [Eumeta japonica]|uniref:Uncharacterized protein n=1 Tax=Eumeta variegata TaxID=151549 RepID=A0A4C1VD01_EUMVA|nr:hypothetical protein EVAR_8346_1 [Eumeta japonica]